MRPRIDLDANATTPVCEASAKALQKALKISGNPSSLHGLGQVAKACLEEARDAVAGFVDAPAEGVYFCGSGSEANNWVLKSVLDFRRRGESAHVVISAIEHSCVMETCRYLETWGVAVTAVPCSESGVMNPGDIQAAIRPDTRLVSVMLANNETGAIQPIAEMAAIAQSAGIPFHTDAVQAAGKLPISFRELGVDYLSLSGHKVYAPKGIGVLVARESALLVPLIHGGSQEKKQRGGTEPVALAAALGAAVTWVQSQQKFPFEALKKRFVAGLAQLPGVGFNGDLECCLDTTVNVSFDGIRSDGLMMALDMAGIAVSTGAACSTGTIEPSHVLLAMGLSKARSSSAIRFSFGLYTTEADIDQTLSVLGTLVPKLRQLS
ncbi:MAG: cysteine desulfurase family protein [Candidatus Margulisiibacteriota bacterium]